MNPISGYLHKPKGEICQSSQLPTISDLRVKVVPLCIGVEIYFMHSPRHFVRFHICKDVVPSSGFPCLYELRLCTANNPSCGVRRRGLRTQYLWFASDALWRAASACLRVSTAVCCALAAARCCSIDLSFIDCHSAFCAAECAKSASNSLCFLVCSARLA